jgi:hypothetical protein
LTGAFLAAAHQEGPTANTVFFKLDIGKVGPLAVGKAEYEWAKIVPREESGPQEIPLAHGESRVE